MSDDRPPRYVEGDRIIYRASGLGMCDKMFVALAMGYEPRSHPAWFQEILDEGTRNESVIRDMWEHNVTDVGHVTEMEIIDGVWIRGAIDGLVHEGQSDIRLQEYKKIRDSGWQRYLTSGVEFQANYPMQTAFYMHSLSEEYGTEVSMDFVGGHYVQDDNGDWSITEVHGHRYHTPPVPLIALKKRIAKLERLIADTDAIGNMSCNVQMFPCPMYYLHDDDNDETPERPSDEIVAVLVKEHDELETEKQTMAPRLAAIDKRQKELKSGVQGWLVAAGQDSGDVSVIQVEGMKVAVKYLVSPRKAYEVPAGEVTRVTIKVTERDGATVAKAPRKSATKKAPASPKEAGTTKRLAPKPGTTGGK